jgi:hypothetical protein
MANPFLTLSPNASLEEICGAAGKIFAQRKAKNQHTNFNTEIWYLAGDALDRGFTALKGMTKERVAREMGNSISRYIDAGRTDLTVTIRGKQYPAKIIAGSKYPGVRVKRSETRRDPSPYAALGRPGGRPPEYPGVVVDCPYCGGEHWYGPGPFTDPVRGVGDTLLSSCRNQGGLFYILH